MCIKIAVCDDDKQAIDEITKYLQKYPDTEIHKFTSASDAMQDNTKFDVAFLDIETGTEDGFDMAKHITDNNSKCIISFFSIHPEYAIKGYSYNIFRYILKSESEHTKRMLIDETMKEYDRQNRKLFIHPKNKNTSSYVLINDITYLESYGRILIIHTDDEDMEWYNPISKAEQELKKYKFIRCHKSYIVNLTAVKSMKDNSVIVLKNGQQIPIGRKYISDVKWAFAMLRNGGF